jgi:hypothetical protein
MRTRTSSMSRVVAGAVVVAASSAVVLTLVAANPVPGGGDAEGAGDQGLVSVAHEGHPASGRRARNVIFIQGDGMGIGAP